MAKASKAKAQEVASPPCIHETAELLSARDATLAPVFTDEFCDRFEVHSYRNASKILAIAHPETLNELVSALMRFRIQTREMVAKGGSKSLIAIKMDDLLNPSGWLETRISGDLYVRQRAIQTVMLPSGRKKGSRLEKLLRIKEFIDGHKIDFVKNRIAFDLEWNSKDQTFDRDLYAFRTFYECGIIDAGILLTRSAELGPVFADIGSRVTMDKFESKYGASTTWMDKLLYRLNAGRAGGCPILALGIRPGVISDFDTWKQANPPIRRAVSAAALTSAAGVGDEDEESEEG